MSEFVNSRIYSNERSEGGELITYMNKLFDQNQWHFKNAVGELSLSSSGVSDSRSKTLFPDIIIFNDNLNLRPLMGWELKMPDVSISDQEFYENARDKAERMGTRAFVLWNFQYCRVFYKKENAWSKVPDREYEDFSDILINRELVQENKNLWQEKLIKVLTDLNEDLVNKFYSVAPIEFNIDAYVETISDELVPITAEYLLEIKDPLLRSKMKDFVKEEQAELTTVNISALSSSNGARLAAKAFAKNIIIRWINRIIFCNIIRRNHNILSDVLYKFIKKQNITDFKDEINESIFETDFYSVLHVDDDEILLPDSVIYNLSEFCNYLWSIDLQNVSGDFISKVLESIIQSTKRQLMGLYTTPVQLAKLLVKLSMRTVDGNFADFTVGSGTIVKEIINELKEFNSIKDVHNHVWASDKYLYPLQVANLNMTTSDSLDLKNIIFRHNALTLEYDESVDITNPSTGTIEHLKIPKFSAIMSNLPFISSNNMSIDDKEIFRKRNLNGKYDLYQGIILHYKNLLKNSSSSRIGVITSNSWFKNQKKSSFFEKLSDNFDIKQIIYSNEARWFNNAKVVATILILAPKTDQPYEIQFIGLNVDIREKNLNYISALADKILIGRQSKDYEINSYKPNEVINFLNTGLCLEALFDDLSWFKEILCQNILIPLKNICDIRRGSRTGADKIFITDGLQTDPKDSHPYIKTLKNISSYEVETTNQFFFYTDLSIKQLEDIGHTKTINYIDSISQSDAAKRMKEKHGEGWYIAEDTPKYGDFITSINPDRRLFWSGFKNKTALNQRVIAASIKDKYVDEKELIQALLNSVIPLFILCGSGFARAEGVTDITKDGLEKLKILNPELLDDEDKAVILSSWKNVKDKKITDIQKQLKDSDWINFNKNILKTFGLNSSLYNEISNAIITLVNRRSKISKS